MTYKVLFHEFDTKEPMQIYEDRSLTVTTIPLRHRMPCCGFLFAEKRRPNHIIREMVDFYQVPVYELNRIKNGADYVTPRENCFQQLVDPSFCSVPQLCLLLGYHLSSFYRGADKGLIYFFMRRHLRMRMRHVPKKHFIQLLHKRPK